MIDDAKASQMAPRCPSCGMKGTRQIARPAGEKFFQCGKCLNVWKVTSQSPLIVLPKLCPVCGEKAALPIRIPDTTQQVVSITIRCAACSHTWTEKVQWPIVSDSTRIVT